MAQTEVCLRVAARSGTSPHGLRSQPSTDWTNLLSHSAVIRTRNHSDLPSKGSREMPNLGQALKCALLSIFGGKIMDSSNHPSKLSSSSFSLLGSQGAWPPRLVTKRMFAFLSRHLRDRTDWVLNANIFRAINLTWGPLQVDLFATQFSAQLRRFFSWRVDPEVGATDALRIGPRYRDLHTHHGS